MALTQVKGSILSDELYRRENNLSDVLDKAIARNNLSVYSKTESDGRYLDEAANLSDLNSVTTARTNLSVYSKSEIDSRLANIPPSIWVGEIRRFSLPVPPPGFFSLDGSLITNGAIDYKPLIDSGCLFIAVEGNNIRLFDQQHFGRGKGSSARHIGQYEEQDIQSHQHWVNGVVTRSGYDDEIDAVSQAASSNDGNYRNILSEVTGGSETRPKSYTELVCLYHGVI